MPFINLQRVFDPDLIFLGDDEAGEYIGRMYLDTRTPVVFWGFNDYPVKYGLIDKADRPGHNVTGIYQTGYYVETLQFLKSLVPGVKTIAVLSDETVFGQNAQQSDPISFAERGLAPDPRGNGATSDYEVWKTKAQELQRKVDAFYIVQYTGLKDKSGNPVASNEVAQWYLANIKIPEAVRGYMVKSGFLCAADDSGYKQAYEAVSVAHDILAKKSDPATYPARTPSRGALMVNRERAKMLGIALTPDKDIEEYN